MRNPAALHSLQLRVASLSHQDTNMRWEQVWTDLVDLENEVERLRIEFDKGVWSRHKEVQTGWTDAHCERMTKRKPAGRPRKNANKKPIGGSGGPDSDEQADPRE